jgi:hypothetical protein
MQVDESEPNGLFGTVRQPHLRNYRCLDGMSIECLVSGETTPQQPPYVGKSVSLGYTKKKAPRIYPSPL